MSLSRGRIPTVTSQGSHLSTPLQWGLSLQHTALGTFKSAPCAPAENPDLEEHESHCGGRSSARGPRGPGLWLCCPNIAEVGQRKRTLTQKPTPKELTHSKERDMNPPWPNYPSRSRLSMLSPWKSITFQHWLCRDTGTTAWPFSARLAIRGNKGTRDSKVASTVMENFNFLTRPIIFPGHLTYHRSRAFCKELLGDRWGKAHLKSEELGWLGFRGRLEQFGGETQLEEVDSHRAHKFPTLCMY